MGRPKKDIDEEVVKNLASRFASQRMIAYVVGCDEKTIRTRFSAVIAQGRAEGQVWLLEKQRRAIEKGSVQMMKWWGIQYLGQRERIEQTIQEITDDRHRTQYVERVLARLGGLDPAREAGGQGDDGDGRPRLDGNGEEGAE